jgi:hypothetical protein
MAVRTKITPQELIPKQRFFLMPSDSQVSSVIYCNGTMAWNIGLRCSEEAGTVSTAAKPPLELSPPPALGGAGFFCQR